MPPPLPSTPAPRVTSFVGGIRDHALLLGLLLGAMWGLEIADHLPFIELDQYGIVPRTVGGLTGILSSPFLHFGFGHLVANTFPFLILGGTVLLAGRAVFWTVTLLVAVLGGLGVWLFGGAFTNHIGASGLVFGYLGYLLARGVFERSLSSLAVSAIMLFLYGGLLFGVLPTQRGISWEAHLFGFLAGLVAARLLVRTSRTADTGI